MSTFPIGINTISDTWTITLEQSLHRLSNLGYKSFDVMVSPAHLDIENMTSLDYSRIRKFLEHEEIEIHALTAQSLDHNLASPREEIRTMTIEFKKRLLDVAYELGAKGIVTVSGRYNSLNAPPRTQLEGWLRHSLEQVVRYAERAGVKIFLENIPMGVLPTASAMSQWIKEINSSNLSACYDVANGHFIGEDPTEAIQILGSDIELIHLSDTGRDAWKHDPVGSGSVNFEQVSSALKSIDYQGLSVIEILSKNADPVINASHDTLTKWGWSTREQQ